MSKIRIRYDNDFSRVIVQTGKWVLCYKLAYFIKLAKKIEGYNIAIEEADYLTFFKAQREIDLEAL